MCVCIPKTLNMKGRFLFLSSGSRLSIMMQFSCLQRGNLVLGDGATYTQPLSAKTLLGPASYESMRKKITIRCLYNLKH
jgi:hypothetical protein